MRWLKKLRKLDARLQKEYRERTKDKKRLNSTQLWFFLGLVSALFSAVALLLSNGIWWSILIAPSYVVIMLILFRKQILI